MADEPELHEQPQEYEASYARWKVDNLPVNIERVLNSDEFDFKVWFDGMQHPWWLTLRQLERLVYHASAEVEIMYRERNGDFGEAAE